MKFRVARHTKDLQRMIFFYVDLIGLEVLGSFEAHDTYDGVFIGSKANDWHLEFTVSNEDPDHHFDEDDLLVFYCASEKDYMELTERLEAKGIQKVQAKNSYWNKHGYPCLDPDGYRVVIALAKSQA
jgi:catechol 2,3-dioxygenase-like lactoylglutathione lyase family enzyme